jgi:hypothetical protein
MAASMNNIDGKKTEIYQLIELMKAELNKVKADLKDELDKVNADAEKLRALNVSRVQARGDDPAWRSVV